MEPRLLYLGIDLLSGAAKAARHNVDIPQTVPTALCMKRAGRTPPTLLAAANWSLLYYSCRWRCQYCRYHRQRQVLHRARNTLRENRDFARCASKNLTCAQPSHNLHSVLVVVEEAGGGYANRLLPGLSIATAATVQTNQQATGNNACLVSPSLLSLAHRWSPSSG